MKILILGGTLFLGRHLVNALEKTQHEVTLFNRGKTNPELFPNVEKIQGDRNEDLTPLAGRKWDVVIDTCGYFPKQVQKTAEFLKESLQTYIFISSISVYDLEQKNIDENTPTLTLKEDQTEDDTSMETYGVRKALCEQALDKILPNKTCHIRPGLIVGPHDPTGRFSYWVKRAARGGKILAPEDSTIPVQIIDVRDLAEWTIRLAEQGTCGVYNAVGLTPPITFRTYVETCQKEAQVPSEFVWLNETFLKEQEIEGWGDFPLWLPAEQSGFHEVSNERALAQGLTFRPLATTVKETKEWLENGGLEKEKKTFGMTPKREEELSLLWEKHQA